MVNAYDLDEAKRLDALNEYGELDNVLNLEFDSVIRLLSGICRVPAAYLTFIHNDKQWVKSQKGFETLEIPLRFSICNHTLKGGTLLEVEDLQNDPRFAENPFVTGDPNFRFYAGVPLKTPSGNQIGTLCVADFEPRKLNEHQLDALNILSAEVIAHLEILKKNRQLRSSLDDAEAFKHLFDHSDDLHCITDAEGTIQYLNRTVEDLLGYTPEEVVGKNIWEFSAPGERDRVMPAIYDAIQRGENRFQIETRVITKDGRTLWFAWADVIIDGHWLVNGRDITERRDHLRRIEELTFAVQKSFAGIIVRNADNQVTWMNEAAEQMLGYTFDEMEGQSFGDLLMGEETDAAIFEYAKECLANKEAYEIEVVLYSKSRKPVWFFISNNPLFGPDGTFGSQIAVMVDISDRKKAEAQLVKGRQDAIDLSKAKETFLSVMSHEMRTPLNAVIGMTRMLKQEGPMESQVEKLNILEFSANNLLTLINDILDFTKIETGNLQLEHAPFDVVKLIDRTIESMQFNVKGKDVALFSKVDPRIPRMIMGDSTRIYQILMNLLGNAVKFTEKGQVELKIRLVKEQEETVTIGFFVSDTGIGIAPDKLEKIFDAYVQAGSDITRKYGGTGLGLSITQKLIRLHDSEISVQSEVGRGSVFSFDLTLKKAVVAAEPIESDAPQQQFSASVLVVDDNPINRLVTRKTLEKWGVGITLAENGREAVEMVRQKDFDLVFMDIHMPELDGLEATRIIRSMPHEKYRKLPIVALTASALKSDNDKFLREGMDDFVLKPFDPDVIYDKLLKYLR